MLPSIFTNAPVKGSPDDLSTIFPWIEHVCSVDVDYFKSFLPSAKVKVAVKSIRLNNNIAFFIIFVFNL